VFVAKGQGAKKCAQGFGKVLWKHHFTTRVAMGGIVPLYLYLKTFGFGCEEMGLMLAGLFYEPLLPRLTGKEWVFWISPGRNFSWRRCLMVLNVRSNKK